MCGFAGYLSKNIKPNKALIVEMAEKVNSRGPDSEGYWMDDRNFFAIGHKRLSILDITNAGNQPMVSPDKRYVLAFNGEIYNHVNLRNEINKIKNVLWQGFSDTETLLVGLSIWSIEEILGKLNGMFSFAFWDRHEKILTIARDRLGQKPLYYGFVNESFLFGSQLKCFSGFPGWNKKLNKESIKKYLKLGYIPAPASIFDNFYKLEAGNYLVLKKNDFFNPKVYKYWNILEKIYLNKKSIKGIFNNNYVENLEILLKNSIKRRMLSDVPLGAFLSGGIDSSTIVSLMQSQSNKPIDTFTIGFNDKNYDESKRAKKVSEFLGTNHKEIIINEKNLLSQIDDLPLIWDEPFSDISQIPTLLICKIAKKDVKVILSGDGGDELFCGYNRYLKGLDLYKFSKNTLPKLFSNLFKNNKKYLIKIINESKKEKFEKFINALSSNTLSQYYEKVVEIFSDDDPITKDQSFSENLLSQKSINDFSLCDEEKLMLGDMIYYLPEDILTKVDRASMSIGLEARSPFMDHELVEYTLKIPIEMKKKSGKGKIILKEILSKYLPSDLINNKKKGFEVPSNKWLNGSLKNWARDSFEKEINSDENLFNKERLKELISDDHYEIRKSQKIWTILMFLKWKEAFFKL